MMIRSLALAFLPNVPPDSTRFFTILPLSQAKLRLQSGSTQPLQVLNGRQPTGDICLHRTRCHSHRCPAILQRRTADSVECIWPPFGRARCYGMCTSAPNCERQRCREHS